MPIFLPAARTLYACLLAAPLLAGCAALGPDYTAPDVTRPAAWGALPDGTAPNPPADRAVWWQGLGDPLLTQMIERALAANNDLDAARAALRQARIRTRIAGTGLDPVLDASASARRSNPAGGSSANSYQAGFDASWEVDLFGGVRRGIEAARADEAAAQAGLDDARVSLAAEVALTYVDLRSYQQRIAIAGANLASQTETEQFTAWRVQAGLASAVDLEQARGSRAQTAAQLPALDTGRREAEHALAVLLGAAPGRLPDAIQTGLEADAPLPALPAQIAVGIPADTLRRRPDIRAAERRLAAETARIGVAEADLYPALRLSGSIGVAAATLGALHGPGSVARALAAAVSGTLFDGGRLRGQRDLQIAVRDRTLAEYRAAVLGALQDVENALVALDSGRLREQALADAADAARNAALLARQRYQGGLIDFQTVLETERTRLSAEDGLAVARAARVTALIQLYKALGGGWTAGAAEDI